MRKLTKSGTNTAVNITAYLIILTDKTDLRIVPPTLFSSWTMHGISTLINLKRIKYWPM